MKRFDLKTVGDLESIRQLKGREWVSIYLYPSFCPGSVRAVDLSNYEGVIFVKLRHMTEVPPVVSYVDDPSDVSWIFENSKSVRIVYPKDVSFPVEHKVLNHSIPVFTERDFLASKRNKYQTFIYYIANPLICSRTPKELFGRHFEKLVFLGEGQKIYFPNTKEWQKFHNSSSSVFRGVSPVFVDQVISIQCKEDFEKLRGITNGVVVVSLDSNLDDVTLESISFKNFVGTLIFLGNHHRIRHLKLWSREDTVGLFSSVHPASHCQFMDLLITDVRYEKHGTQQAYGTILGKREEVNPNATAHFMPGGISFSHCFVESVVYPKNQLEATLGVFVGCGDDAMDFDQCYGDSCVDSMNADISSFLGKEKLYLSSGCHNIYEKPYGRRLEK